jgi:hypothetical protein
MVQQGYKQIFGFKFCVAMSATIKDKKGNKGVPSPNLILANLNILLFGIVYGIFGNNMPMMVIHWHHVLTSMSVLKSERLFKKVVFCRGWIGRVCCC